MSTSKRHTYQKTYWAPSTWVKGEDFTQSPFRYPGGKYYALKFIVPFLTAFPHDEYREPFVGGGSVFFGKPKAEHNWLNDLEPDLIDTYAAIKSARRSKLLCERVTAEIATRERHAEIKALTPATKDDIAFRTYYLNRTSYSGIINKPAWGYALGSSSPPENWHRFIKGAHKKLSGVQLTTGDFTTVLDARPSGKSVLMYLDPPYFLADQKRAYTKPFTLADHERLAKHLRSLPHAFVLSYDDCSEIRDLYSWAFTYTRSWFYNTANSAGPRKVGRELLITNYRVEHLEQFELL